MWCVVVEVCICVVCNGGGVHMCVQWCVVVEVCMCVQWCVVVEVCICVCSGV